MTSAKLGPDPAHVRLATTDLSGNANLTDIRPSAIGELNGATLVITRETLAVGTVGAEREPESILKNARVDVDLNLRTPGLLIRAHAMESISK